MNIPVRNRRMGTMPIAAKLTPGGPTCLPGVVSKNSGLLNPLQGVS